MHISHLHLQYDRLKRHHGGALRDKDEISFLDLAHALRVWVDMKATVTGLAKERNLELELAHHTPPKSIKRSLKGAVHTYLPLASGVNSPGVQVAGIRITNRALTPEEIKARAAMGPPVALPSKMTFSEWLAAGILEVPSGKVGHPHLTLSREIVIKRVANVLGASHPAGMEDSDPLENRFDPYIKDLHGIQLADGYPATYYQLLEIAGEILVRTRCLRDSAASQETPSK
jgi:hypothetical protein